MDTFPTPLLCPHDPTSFANTDHVRTTHLHLNLVPDFSSCTLSGSVTLTLDILIPTNRIVLDSSHLIIHSIHRVSSTSTSDDHNGDSSLLSPLLFTMISPPHPKFGSPILIQLPELTTPDTTSSIKIIIQYSTTNLCTAGQWLTPHQTVGKQHPYFFTQCQAIHARSLIPMQDTPSIKVTYTAYITVPNPLRALMSALRTGDHPCPTRPNHHIYQFHQPISIPSYLIAMAIGNIQGIPVGPRTTVWSEPEIVQSAAHEFSDTEKLIQLGEKLIMPYEWKIYDLIVLPSSFPYGGMENACLTFVTPTLLAGDKSLVDVITHEFAHSYAGNLVTTKNWEHFWLNEGWCVYLERKLIANMHGENHRQLHARIGEKALKESVELFGDNHPYTCLCLNLSDVDPDDSFSSVPYEKGFALLYLLEQVLGDTEFSVFTKAYFKHFAGQSIDTNDFKQFLYTFIEHYFGQDKIDALNKSIDWDTWLYKPGMPPVTNQYSDELARPCMDLALRWDQSRCITDDQLHLHFSHSDIALFHTLQKMLFLENIDTLSTSLPHTHLTYMDQTYQFSTSTNCEILYRWLTIALRAHYIPMYNNTIQFLSHVGRMKYVRPLFRLLNQVVPDGHTLAVNAFNELKSSYHPICSQLVMKDLGIA